MQSLLSRRSTDNVNRSASDVKAAITKAGGKVADPGSVLFNFARQGLIMVDAAEGEGGKEGGRRAVGWRASAASRVTVAGGRPSCQRCLAHTLPPPPPLAGEDKVFEAAMDAGAADIQQATDDDGTLTGFKVRRRSSLCRRRRRGWPELAACIRPLALSSPLASPHTLITAPQVLTAVEDYGSVNASLSGAGLAIQPEASGLVYVPLVQQEVDDEQARHGGGARGGLASRKACCCSRLCSSCAEVPGAARHPRLPLTAFPSPFSYPPLAV